MRSAIPSPTACYRDEHIRHIRDKVGLLLWRKQQIAVSQMLCSEGRKNSAANSEIRLPHMRTLFRSRQTERNSPKIISIHESNPPGRSILRRRI